MEPANKSMITAKQVRKRRICKKYFHRECSPAAIFPDIRLCGKWLLETGFNVGQYIQISCEENKIVITPFPEEK